MSGDPSDKITLFCVGQGVATLDAVDNPPREWVPVFRKVPVPTMGACLEPVHGWTSFRDFLDAPPVNEPARSHLLASTAGETEYANYNIYYIISL